MSAACVLNCYARETGILSLGWLPFPERREFHLLKLPIKHFSSPTDQQIFPRNSACMSRLERYGHLPVPTYQYQPPPAPFSALVQTF